MTGDLCEILTHTPAHTSQLERAHESRIDFSLIAL